MNISRDILLTLGYFDNFSYPLKKREIFLFLPFPHSSTDFDDTLNLLIEDSLVYELGEFYSLQNNFELVQRRRKGNEMAKDLLKVAKKVSTIISRFPFVRGVAISGSLSKNYADERSDIDLFIICKSNRLWIARTILHCFKKMTFLFGLQHYFCMNYFIDEQKLEIPEKNIYTATEIATLIPLHGTDIFQQFFSVNHWTKEFLPNNYLRISSSTELARPYYKRIIEWCINALPATTIDSRLMKITSSRWDKKFRKKKINNRGIIMSMSASKHAAKPDPKQFQEKLVSLYLARVVAFEMVLQEKLLIKPLH